MQLRMRAVCLGVAWTLLAVVGTRPVGAAEEHIRGVLERTVREGACAQITDALNETYYVRNTPEAEKLCRPLFGETVVLMGVVEQHAGDPVYYLELQKAERMAPPAPVPPKGTPPKAGP